LFIGSVAVCGAAPSEAQAVYKWLNGGTEELVQERIRLGEIDLSDAKQLREVRHSLGMTAKRLCEGDRDSPNSLVLNAAECRLSALRAAERELQRLRSRSRKNR
jgi:UrcA family protein